MHGTNMKIIVACIVCYTLLMIYNWFKKIFISVKSTAFFVWHPVFS